MKINTREAHILKYTAVSLKKQSQRPFKSSEVKNTLILTVRQVSLSSLPPLASCSNPQHEALNLILPEKQSWPSLDIWVCVCRLCCFSGVCLFVTLWTVARLAPLSMGFSRQECWSGCHALLQGTFPTQGSNPHLLMSPELAGRFFTTSTTWEALHGPNYCGFYIDHSETHNPRLRWSS